MWRVCRGCARYTRLAARCWRQQAGSASRRPCGICWLFPHRRKTSGVMFVNTGTTCVSTWRSIKTGQGARRRGKPWRRIDVAEPTCANSLAPTRWPARCPCGHVGWAGGLAGGHSGNLLPVCGTGGPALALVLSRHVPLLGGEQMAGLWNILTANKTHFCPRWNWGTGVVPQHNAKLWLLGKRIV